MEPANSGHMNQETELVELDTAEVTAADGCVTQNHLLVTVASLYLMREVTVNTVQTT